MMTQVTAATHTGSLTGLARNLRSRLLIARLAVADAEPFRRTLDIVAGIAGLAVLAPVLLVAIVAVKLTSRGPVFFWQTRVGQHGRTFAMPKFRTMVTGADALKASLTSDTAGVTFKMKRDPRITGVGRILRKLSIDELPQLATLVTGEMTLVGPRPAVPKEVAAYSPRDLRRLEVKPGLTCLWQIGGRSDLTFAQQVDLDLQYIDRTNLAREIEIVVRTPLAVLSGRGAY